ncbi:hypothetical protein, partial [Methylicorpusculum sp.]
MKSVIKFFAGASLFAMLFAAVGVANAQIAPDALVKQTADDVLTIIKNDKDIQSGNQQKLYAVVE